MKKIYLKGISVSLSENEMKNVLGGMNLTDRCQSYNVDDERLGVFSASSWEQQADTTIANIGCIQG